MASFSESTLPNSWTQEQLVPPLVITGSPNGVNIVSLVAWSSIKSRQHHKNYFSQFSTTYGGIIDYIQRLTMHIYLQDKKKEEGKKNEFCRPSSPPPRLPPTVYRMYTKERLMSLAIIYRTPNDLRWT
ncbi:hypothetical protein BO71DRAFT_206503 [Aspergillus ellipticus CBS 707.79]|uniref:Uncharacterized protein n=1 Tax=Aspergillus ellipticus CBS 707.79 TaxID=1448320 RepID=A0A319DSK8_9EURO|nr:hypothetical protein BO71DRAFT_206503 [Aspergillus ellipticus CBS 707.79]